MALAKKRSGASLKVAPQVLEATHPGVVAAGLHLARVRAASGDDVELELAGESVRALRDPSLDPQVLATAVATGERVLVEAGPTGRLVVVGALRTRPVPGVDRAHSFEVEADRFTMNVQRFELEAEEQAVLASKTARLVLRAAGEIESFADRIVSRASGVHKIVGRMLRLN